MKLVKRSTEEFIISTGWSNMLIEKSFRTDKSDLV